MLLRNSNKKISNISFLCFVDFLTLFTAISMVIPNNNYYIFRKRYLRHEDKSNWVGPVSGHGSDLYGRYWPGMRGSRSTTVHTGHATTSNAVVLGGRIERPIGQQRIELAEQGATDGNQRAGTGQTMQIHVRHRSRGGICRITSTRFDCEWLIYGWWPKDWSN